jgi:hypothetical protein
MPVHVSTAERTHRQLAVAPIHITNRLYSVFDPLEPGLSLPDSVSTLERCETAWMELDLREPNAGIDAPVPAKSGPPVDFSLDDISS